MILRKGNVARGQGEGAQYYVITIMCGKGEGGGGLFCRVSGYRTKPAVPSLNSIPLMTRYSYNILSSAEGGGCVTANVKITYRSPKRIWGKLSGNVENGPRDELVVFRVRERL